MTRSRSAFRPSGVHSPLWSEPLMLSRSVRWRDSEISMSSDHCLYGCATTSGEKLDSTVTR